jgi:VWFA-related protein
MARRLRFTCLVFFACLATCGVARGSQEPQPPIQPAPTFRSGAQLIVQAVAATDDSGRAIEDLTADDFVVTEDGNRQAISFVEFQRLDTTPLGIRAESRPQTDRTVEQVDPGIEPTFVGSVPGDSRYANRRLLVLYFDLSTLAVADLLRAGDAALRFLDRQMTAADLVAVMTFNHGVVRIKHDFTGDRDALSEIVDDIVRGDDKDGDGLPELEPGSPFGQNDAEFNVFSTDRQLAALQTAVTMLRVVAEQKSLVYFGGGLRLNGTDNQAQLRATINAAIRSNVVIHTVDARGLVAIAPLGDATQASPGGIGMFTGQAVNATLTALHRSQDALYALAKGTGGNALFDSNDLLPGIVRAAGAVDSYYLIGYYSTHAQRDGRFRRLHVSLRSGLSGRLAHRQGYFAEKEFAKFTTADKERQLEDALLLEDPITEITMAVEVNYFQLNRAEYLIAVSVKIPGAELALARRRGEARTVIDLIGEVKDEFGYTYQNLRDKLDVRLDDQTAAQLANRPWQIEIGFTLLPGSYSIKLLARDAGTGRIGTYLATFTVPNLARETILVPTSSVVLSTQRVALKDAAFNARQKMAAEAVNPLVTDGFKLMPSVTRVFQRDQDLFVFLQAYEASRPLVAFVTFFRGDVKSFETVPLVVVANANDASRPLRFNVPLERFSPGLYECQVSVLDPQGQKVAFWRAPIVIAQATASSP